MTAVKDILTKFQECEEHINIFIERNYPSKMSAATRIENGIEQLIICDDYEQECLTITEKNGEYLIRELDGTLRWCPGHFNKTHIYNIVKTIMQGRCLPETRDWKRTRKNKWQTQRKKPKAPTRLQHVEN